MRPSHSRLIVVGGLLLLSACRPLAGAAGRSAVSEASREFRANAAQVDSSQPGPLAERMARGAVRGTFSQLSSAAQLEQLSAAVRTSAEAAVRGGMDGALAEMTRKEVLAEIRVVAQEAAASALRGLAQPGGPQSGHMVSLVADHAAQGVVDALSRELGPSGDGPLARSLYATTERLSASALRGVQDVGGVFPDCQGPERELCIERRVTDLSRAASVGVGEGLRGFLAVPSLVAAFLLGLIAALVFCRIRARAGGERLR